LTAENWESALLSDIVERAVAPYRDGEGGSFTVAGPAVRVSPRLALAFSMILHELTTNAIKHGALSAAEGGVSIDWSMTPKSDGSVLILVWRERGGPSASPPQRRGFGTRLIERALVADMGETVDLNFAREGLICTITAPLTKQ
jgi:two-component sensor histidine kinase